MIRTLILCNWGNSSGNLARALNKYEGKSIYSEERGIQATKLPDQTNWDIVIIAPHISHNLSELKKHFTNIPVIIGNPVGYYSCDTKVITKQIKKTLN